jgi:transcriptional regulator with XRE-family HTH domain
LTEAALTFNVAKVGERLRTYRLRRRATLKQVAIRAGVSESFLSQVERGRAGASIGTLHRIASALDVRVSDLFEADGADRSRVLRRAQRPVLTFPEGLTKYLLTPRPLEHLEVIFGEIDIGGSTGDEAYSHGDSEELFLVVSGVVRAQIGPDTHVLLEGDSIDYRSSCLHLFQNAGQDVAQVIWVISPPSY